MATTLRSSPQTTAPESFDAVYQTAAGRIDSVPWARGGRPNPAVVTWLNAVAPSLVRPGGRAVVVGCGLGDDAAELAARGYDASGFDVSPSAVMWARRRFPEIARSLFIADLFDLPPRLIHRFDAVIEAGTLEWLPPERRPAAAKNIAALAGPVGVVLAVSSGCDEPGSDSDADDTNAGATPSPLTPAELTRLFTDAGLTPIGDLSDFSDDACEPPARRLRCAFARGEH